MKINCYAVGKNAAPIERYVHKLAHFAVRAVGADQILARERTLPTTLDVFGEDGDGVVILLDVDDLEPVRDLCASSFGAVAEGSARDPVE